MTLWTLRSWSLGEGSSLHCGNSQSGWRLNHPMMVRAFLAWNKTVMFHAMFLSNTWANCEVLLFCRRCPATCSPVPRTVRRGCGHSLVRSGLPDSCNRCDSACQQRRLARQSHGFPVALRTIFWKCFVAWLLAWGSQPHRPEMRHRRSRHLARPLWGTSTHQDTRSASVTMPRNRSRS